MQPAAIPDNETERLAALHSLRILDTAPSAAFDAIAKAASLVCGTPIALICLVDEHRQWFKANIGLENVSETPRDLAFCAHTILGEGIMEVKDASMDQRFADSPLVLADPKIRFYAAAPLRLQDGNVAGTLCVIDREPRQLNSQQLEVLDCLATAASQALEQWRSDAQLRESVDALHQSQEFLEHAGRHDCLTALLNRSEFELQLRSMLQEAQARRSENAMLFINLDQFKLINDNCGHEAGDRLLIQVAQILKDTVRIGDILARLGGDEFAILLSHCSTEAARQVAQIICDRLDDFRFAHEHQRLRVGASIGLVPLNEHWPDTAAIMLAAEGCCRAAKEAGRNRVHSWARNDVAVAARHHETQWAARLEQALDDGSFLLYAQRLKKLETPGDGAKNNSRIHAEILLRLQETDGVITLPGAFLPAAERFHIASRIDRWVLNKVIAWMTGSATLNCIELLCVNLSGQSVGDPTFRDWAIEMLSRAGPGICQLLCLEITETAAVTNLACAASFIAQLREIGVRVALDDFGAGASSFGYLKTMPVDFLKIDGQFVRNLMTENLNEAAVRCFTDVAAVAGMQTIAEFVQSDEVLNKLTTMGVNFAQGYFIHYPAPLDELLNPFPRSAQAALPKVAA